MTKIYRAKVFLGKKNIKYFTYLPTLFQNIGSEKGKQTIF